MGPTKCEVLKSEKSPFPILVRELCNYVPCNVPWFAVYEIVADWFAFRFVGKWDPVRTLIQFLILDSVFLFVFQFSNPESWCICCIMFTFLYESLTFAQPWSLPLSFSAICNNVPILCVTLVCICMCILLTLPAYEFRWWNPLAVVVEWDLIRVRLCICTYTAVYVLLTYVQFAQCFK
jgi:hypothetical protein